MSLSHQCPRSTGTDWAVMTRSYLSRWYRCQSTQVAKALASADWRHRWQAVCSWAASTCCSTTWSRQVLKAVARALLLAKCCRAYSAVQDTSNVGDESSQRAQQPLLRHSPSGASACLVQNAGVTDPAAAAAQASSCHHSCIHSLGLQQWPLRGPGRFQPDMPTRFLSRCFSVLALRAAKAAARAAVCR